MTSMSSAIWETKEDPEMEKRIRKNEAEERQKKEAILKAWENKPKGPELTEEELDKIRHRFVFFGYLPTPEEVRRMLQTIDSVRLGHRRGTLKEFPLLFTVVYMQGVDIDIHEGEVIGHLPNGHIRVKTQIGDTFVEEEWSSWMSREEAGVLS